jgi:uncharacterized protein YegL
MNLRQEKKEKILRVAIILDESGSMGAVKKETLDGLNEHLQELRKGKEKGITTYVTLVTFSGAEDIKERYNNILVDEMPDLTDKDFDPNGLTAMYDGVARGLNLLRSAEDTENTTYIALIITDGAENNSKEFQAHQIKDIITKLEETKKWTITYMGANQNIFEVQETLGLSAGNIASYASSSIGTRSAFRKMSESTAEYMFRLNSPQNNTVNCFYNSTGSPADFTIITDSTDDTN